MDLVTISDHRRRKSSSLLTRDSSHFLLISVALIGAVFLIYTNMKKSSFSESDVGFRRNNHHNNKIKVANRIHESEKKRSRPESDDSDNNKREKIHDEMKNNPYDSVEENSVNNKHYEAREVETEFQDTKDKRQKPGREEERSHEEYNDVDKEAPKKHERVYQDTRDDGADPKSHDENSEGEKHYDEEFEKNFTPDYDDDNKNELSHKQMNEVQRNADQDSQRFGEESFKRERKDFRHKSAKGRDDDEDLENDNDREEDSNFQKLNNDAKHPSDEQEDDETKEENKSINSMKKQPSEDKIVPDKTNSENVAQEIPESGKQEKAGRVSQADDEEKTHDLPEEKPRFGKVSDDEGKRASKPSRSVSENYRYFVRLEDTIIDNDNVENYVTVVKLSPGVQVSQYARPVKIPTAHTYDGMTAILVTLKLVRNSQKIPEVLPVIGKYKILNDCPHETLLQTYPKLGLSDAICAEHISGRLCQNSLPGSALMCTKKKDARSSMIERPFLCGMWAPLTSISGTSKFCAFRRILPPTPKP
ncbi:unnamed protein product [Notodromas monacha]|uniref:Uncharacterized protein n=1 Tax=Notodromas monacha TaxID=399045 RepID=A0A7R9BDB2_9CRUS|nr:unnamed protein product [Notodromas monacha]CAG0913265.1 unnamed protein product [Notodromas monacha]